MGLVFLIDRPGYRLATDRKVLKRNEAAVIEEITQAYVRAQGEINTALTNLDRICKQATDEAHRAGLAKAEREATQRWTLAEVERRILLETMRPMLAEMVVDAVSLLVGEIDRKTLMMRALEMLQGSLRSASWACLRVPAQDVSLAERAVRDLDRQTNLGKVVRVVADESLPEGGCVLESDLGKIDASLSTQLETLRAAISDAARLSETG
jgi:type III secretion protein L